VRAGSETITDSPAAVPDRNPDRPIVSDVLLRRLADLLAARGMEIRKYDHGEEIIEIAVVNPRDPDRGRVVFGYDGFLVWEYRSAFKINSDADSSAETICALLTKNITETQRPAGAVRAPKAPARVALDEARAGPPTQPTTDHKPMEAVVHSTWN
jgi:hypothetical protein